MRLFKALLENTVIVERKRALVIAIKLRINELLSINVVNGSTGEEGVFL